MTTYLAKASDALVSHCKCTDDALITFPPQLECPWCGCGWLFTCITCRKAFAVARGVKTDRSLRDIGWDDLKRKYHRDPQLSDVLEWVRVMEALLSHVVEGGEYVYLDGAVFPMVSGRVLLDGWHSSHDLPMLPHVAGLVAPSAFTRELADPKYWARTAHPSRQ